MSSRAEILAGMQKLVQHKTTVHQLTIDHCLPALAKQYAIMSSFGWKASSVSIGVIIDGLTTKTDRYVCADVAVLSYQICVLLNQHGIPATYFTAIDPVTHHLSIVGVTLGLYRQ